MNISDRKINSFNDVLPDTTQFTYDGFYRAIVVDNKDPDMYGKVKVFIPDFMYDGSDSTIERDSFDPEKDGIWALPANNPVGGRNEKNNQHYGSCYIPQVGSMVWIFFENGRIDRPFYLSSLDIQIKKVPPENQLGDEYWNKWTVLRSPKGRVIVISDDPSDERVEITGKKRLYNSKDENATSSVYTIDNNQTTILIDERNGKEKILIKDYKGNFICIEQQDDSFNLFMNGDMKVQIKGKTHLTFEDDVNIYCKKDVKIKIDGKLIKETGEVSNNINGDINIKAHNFKFDGTRFDWKNGVNITPITTQPEEPKGDRDG